MAVEGEEGDDFFEMTLEDYAAAVRAGEARKKVGC